MLRAVLEPLGLFLDPFRRLRDLSHLARPLSPGDRTLDARARLDLDARSASPSRRSACSSSASTRRAATASMCPRISKTACSFPAGSNEKPARDRRGSAQGPERLDGRAARPRARSARWRTAKRRASSAARCATSRSACRLGDFDLATTARPEVVMKRARGARASASRRPA